MPTPSCRLTSGTTVAGRVHRLLTLTACALALVTLPGKAWDVDRLTATAPLYGASAVSGVQALRELLARIAGSGVTEQLDAVNRFYNERIVFRTDLEVWGRVDYWASPLEMMGKGAGDCEDYAIGKYFTLLAAGVPESSLRLVYVRADLPGSSSPVAHMVLAHYANPNADPSILDNLVRSVQPASTRRDLTPVFSFNGAGLWQGGAAASSGDPQARLSPWRDVVAKAHAEGF